MAISKITAWTIAPASVHSTSSSRQDTPTVGLGQDLALFRSKLKDLKSQGLAVVHQESAKIEPEWSKAVWKLVGRVCGTSSASFKTRIIENNPSDVNHPSSSEVARAATALSAHLAAEQAALAKLPAAARTQYQAVQTQILNRPMARRELQKMLLDRRLPGEKDLLDQESVLAQLQRLTIQPLAKDIDREQLVSDAIGEIENPVRIDQHDKGTCGATTAQILLARQHPAEYLRLIGGLASPEGRVTMFGGKHLSRVADWNASNDGGRSIPSRLLQPAFMNQAEIFSRLSYDNTSDENRLGEIALGGGLFDAGLAKLCAQLEGTPFRTLTFLAWNRDTRWNQVKDTVDRGRGPIPVSLEWVDQEGPGGHYVQIDKIASGRVYYTNPWGMQESMTEAEFKSHLMGALIPEA